MMRLISQDGVYDLPYDMTILTRDGGQIVAGVIGEDTEVVMAEYSHEEDAIAELKRLHQNYGLMITPAFKFVGNLVHVRPLDEA